ncbi:MAG: carboxypeptidase regulatory-like domain-containing protein [Myxococcota bacterium]|nr:carboxypeptidase regulatory-like domain-containing protein [Myxococcota bacterium]
MGCKADTVCGIGLNCINQTCTDGTIPNWPFTIRIKPASDSISGAGELPFPTFNESPFLNLADIKLPSPSEITGSVSLPNGSRISVKVTARAQSNISPSLTYEGETSDDVNGARFAMRLPAVWPGENGTLQTTVYALHLRPTERSRFPPWVVVPFQVPTDGGRINLEVPAQNEMLVTTGIVYQSEINPIPIRELRVYAVNLNGQRISTETRTDALGRFTLRYWPSVAGQDAILRILATTASGPLPTLEKPFTVPDNITSDDSMTFEPIYIGVDDAVEWINGRVLGATPVSGVSIRFVSDVGQGTYRYDVVQTDADGQFRALLYPGDYVVDLIPPLGSGYRITRLQSQVASESFLEFRPQTKATVRGQILGPSGDPIVGATVSSLLLQAAYADPRLARPSDVAPSRGQRTQTDAQGRYVLQLDPGAHEMRAEPPAASGLSTYIRELTVTPLDLDLANTDIQLPSAANLTVRVLDDGGQPLVGAQLEVWRTDDLAPKRIGSQRTDAFGRVSVRLPAAD